MATISSILFPKLIETKKISIDPFYEIFCGPQAYAIHMGETVDTFNDNEEPIDPLKMNRGEIRKKHINRIDLSEQGHEYVIAPGEYIEVNSFEHVGVHKSMEAEVRGSSSLRRIGVDVLGGDLDPGHGMTRVFRYTLCMYNFLRSTPVVLTATYVDEDRWEVHWGLHVGKIKFKTMEKTQGNKYKDYDKWPYGVYAGQTEPETSLAGEKFEAMRRRPAPLPKDSRYRKGVKSSTLDHFNK